MDRREGSVDHCFQFASSVVGDIVLRQKCHNVFRIRAANRIIIVQKMAESIKIGLGLRITPRPLLHRVADSSQMNENGRLIEPPVIQSIASTVTQPSAHTVPLETCGSRTSRSESLLHPGHKWIQYQQPVRLALSPSTP